MSTLAQPNVTGEARSAFKRRGLNGSNLPLSSHPFRLAAAVAEARRCLLSLQESDGHWCGELQGDTILESEFIMLMAFLGREHEERVRKAARYVVSQQRPEG